jgi:hypothetical protein
MGWNAAGAPYFSREFDKFLSISCLGMTDILDSRQNIETPRLICKVLRKNNLEEPGWPGVHALRLWA